MNEFKLGDLFSIKMHPFRNDCFDILIGADAAFISPVLVVIEVRNFNNQHDINTGDKESRQVKGVFYSHRSQKFEQHWFRVEEVQLLQTLEDDRDSLLMEKDRNLTSLKKSLKYKFVILRSVDLELNKRKANRESKNLEYPILKQTAYLDFVPPIMQIIDVRNREMKDNYFKNSGDKKTDFSTVEVKCKWYNPNICSFSEEWIAVDSLREVPVFDVETISNLKNKYFVYKYPEEFNKDIKNLKQTHSLIKIKQVLFNHYQYQIVVDDIINKKLQFVSIDDFDASQQEIEYDSVFDDILPNYKARRFRIEKSDFREGEFYEISYLSDRGQLTKRYVYVVEKIDITAKDEESGTDDTLLIAYCMLRNGEVRHFKLSNIKSSKKMKKHFSEKLFEL